MLNLDWHFFPVFDRLDPATVYPSTYNLGLVATSLAIAILAAFVAFSISGRIAAATTRRARYAWASYAWASAGAISMGGGIWSMHFVGMLAFSLPCVITYDPVGTVLSMIPGILASGIALTTISKPREPGLSPAALEGLEHPDPFSTLSEKYTEGGANFPANGERPSNCSNCSKAGGRRVGAPRIPVRALSKKATGATAGLGAEPAGRVATPRLRRVRLEGRGSRPAH